MATAEAEAVKQALVWFFFERKLQESNGEFMNHCRNCDWKEKAGSGSTSNMWRHLASEQHKLKAEEIKKLEPLVSPNLSPRSPPNLTKQLLFLDPAFKAMSDFSPQERQRAAILYEGLFRQRFAHLMQRNVEPDAMDIDSEFDARVQSTAEDESAPFPFSFLLQIH